MSIQLFDLTGKNVLITGSARGLGLAIGTGLAEAGAQFIISDVNAEGAEKSAAELRARGLKATTCNFDVTSDEAVKNAIDKIEKEIGTLDILVNNAGVNLRGALEEMELATWQKVIDINLTAVWRVSKFAAQKMIPRKRGKIINIASLMTFGGRPTTGPYTATKTAIAGLTRAMTVEWAQHNIQINAIGPGYFLTDMTKPLADNPEFDGWVKMRTPAKRWGLPKELVGLAIFYASSASDFVTGQVCYVDGGWTSNL
ncbi:SDR family oxidoreductase [bacterium]|nr:SDR family oxidoreductase [bacterium]